MKILSALGLCLLVATSNSGVSQEVKSGPAPRVVNVTPDSEKGWIPSEELEKQARQTAIDFMADEDSGRVAEAYALLADIDKKDQPFAGFSDGIRKFNAQAARRSNGASLPSPGPKIRQRRHFRACTSHSI